MRKMIIVAAVLMLAACSKETNDERVAVQFSGTVGVTQTKAVDQTWSANDAIGIYMVKTDEAFTTENISERAANIRYVVDATRTGGFKADGSTIYYPMDASPVDFYAYYPQGSVTNNATTGNYEYALDVATQNNQEALDFMFSNNVKNKSKADRTAALTFSHCLSKMVLTISTGAGMSEAEMADLTVTVKDQNTTQTFNLSKGALMADAANPANIALYKQADEFIYEAILLPNAATSREFIFSLNNSPKNEVFTWVMDRALTAGNKYTYSVKLNRTGIEVTGTISDWTEVDGGQFDAN